MIYPIDSDVLIWHLRGHQPTVHLLRELAQQGRAGEEVLPLGCSVISVFEVRAGMRPKEEGVTEQLLSTLEIYPVDEAVARRAADYYRAFSQRGVTLHIADLLIAATVSIDTLTLVTYNRSHFLMEDIDIYEQMPEF